MWMFSVLPLSGAAREHAADPTWAAEMAPASLIYICFHRMCCTQNDSDFPSYLWNGFSSSGQLRCFAHFTVGGILMPMIVSKSLVDFGRVQSVSSYQESSLFSEYSGVCFNDVLPMPPSCTPCSLLALQPLLSKENESSLCLLECFR